MLSIFVCGFRSNRIHLFAKYLFFIIYSVKGIWYLCAQRLKEISAHNGNEGKKIYKIIYCIQALDSIQCNNAYIRCMDIYEEAEEKTL